MVYLKANDIGLEYRMPRRLTLARGLRRAKGAGGRIRGAGRSNVVVALDGVNFELSAGDRLGLVGHNGSGKTTLLKVLFGIFEPSRGNLQMCGKVDALFNINLGFRLGASGRRNIELRGLINGWSKREIDRRMAEIIEFSELGEFIDLPMKTYSQGMATRLAFSVATTLEPEILLMDEWIGAGDPEFQEKARARMDTIASKAGIIVLATHNHELMHRTCNKVLALEKGVVAYFGSMDEWAAMQESA